MTFKELKNKIKEEQKQLASKIRLCKPLRKPSNYSKATNEVKEIYKYNYRYSNDFRHRHIVYCTMFNKTPYEKIEQPRHNNLPSKYTLEKIKNQWEKQLDEDVRSCS